MTTHKYKNWTIYKRDNGEYLASRNSDSFLAPESYKLLHYAKQAIDNGDANLTVAEFKARDYHMQLQCGAISKSHLEFRAYHLADRAAEIALQGKVK